MQSIVFLTQPQFEDYAPALQDAVRFFLPNATVATDFDTSRTLYVCIKDAHLINYIALVVGIIHASFSFEELCFFND